MKGKNKAKKSRKSKKNKTQFIISIDQGTTGSRVFCFDPKGKVVSSAYKEFTQYFPKPGWVEHDAQEIWNGVQSLLGKAIKAGGLNEKNAIGIGITNQRETTVVWEKKTGKPIHRAIVWQCRRTSKICDRLKSEGHENIIREKTGLVLDAYFSGTKIAWILDNVDGARERAGNSELMAGTIDSWLLFKLTGEHATDFTNASRTLLFNIKTRKWDPELLEILNVPEILLPKVHPSRFEYGTTKGLKKFPDGIRVLSMIGDQQSALFGQLRVHPGEAKNTYGTGCFLLFNTGQEFISSNAGLLTTLACDADGQVCYALEGSVFIGGAVVQWLRDYMKFFKQSPKSEKLAIKVDDEPDEVVFVPAFAGLGAPYWDMNARGAVFGLTRDTTPARITRAALKSIALQSYDLVKAMEQDTGKRLDELRVDGGATSNNYLMQYQADILDIPVIKPSNSDTTALGAAYLAGMQANIWPQIQNLQELQADSTRLEPVMKPDLRSHELHYWKKAVKRVKNWID